MASIPSGNSVVVRDPWAPILDVIVSGLGRSLRELGAELPDDVLRNALNADGGPEGDVAFPVHRAAAVARTRPDAFAQKLAAACPRPEELRAVEAKGAYVNFMVDPARLISTTLGAALSLRERWGEGAPSDGVASVEHTSANPTGPFHIGRVRNAIIGDTFARVLRAAGTSVTTQYYVDDMGRQASLITWIWSKDRGSWPEPIRAAVEGREVPGEKPDHYRGRPYPAVSAYLKDHPEAREEVARLIAQAESGSPPPLHRELAQSVLDGMLASLARLGIRYDEFVWESDFVRDGSVERVLGRLRSAPHAVREENGAWAIDTSGRGLPKESTHVVVERGDGTSLYVTRDIAFHLQKFGRFARVIDVLGADHLLHARTLEALLAEVGESRRPEFILYAYIHSPEGGKMSAREGTAVYLDDLLAEAVERARREVRARRQDLAPAEVERIAEAIASGAVRYHVVRIAPDKPVVFRWEDALSFEGRSGPFLQYSYARASSVLRKAELGAGPFPFDAGRLTDPEELALVRVLSRFPRTVAYAARTTHVHAVAGYAHDVADQFNRFYHAVPVLRSGEERASRIALVAATRQTLGNALELLGVPRLETM